ncbi:MAG: 50S ribosomal protein L10 [Patescibacteria group bacterium]|nr:50S ribosomal protein L10 [Patescibacteria group bacterium]
MDLEEKKQLVKDLKKELKKAKSVTFVDFSGLGAGVLDNLRGQLLEQDAQIRVAKNTLITRALDNFDFNLEGPTALVFSFGDALKGIKVVSNFQEEAGNLEFKGGVFEGALVSGSEVLELAEIPGREMLLAQFSSLLNAPLQRFVANASAPLQRFGNDLRSMSKES